MLGDRLAARCISSTGGRQALAGTSSDGPTHQENEHGRIKYRAMTFFRAEEDEASEILSRPIAMILSQLYTFGWLLVADRRGD